ncbi:MAG TPA: helix-turn-helix transcriptional regulator, partial [Polyangiaceae bacterium]|nr:helix-turn-helix transcriptional regulator [Polyangiaceae bacterium]
MTLTVALESIFVKPYVLTFLVNNRHDEDMSAFAQLLRDLKPEHVTWSQVAAGMGVSPSYISLLASGKRGASREQVEEIARHMGIDAAGLLIASGHVPDDLLAIMARYPKEARAALVELDRRLAGEGSAQRARTLSSE